MSSDEQEGAPLATLCFEGARFHLRGIPVDVLDEAKNFMQILVACAKRLYLQEHPGEDQPPPGFEEEHRVRLDNISEGSSKMAFVLDTDPNELAIARGPYAEPAAREIGRLLQSGADKDGTQNGHADYSDFHRFGRTLQREDRLHYSSLETSTTLDYAEAERIRKLARRKPVRPPKVPKVRVGVVKSLDTAKKSIEFESIGAAKRDTLSYDSEEVFARLRDALEFEPSGEVFVVCLPRLRPHARNDDAEDDWHSVSMVSDAEVISDVSVVERYGTICDRLVSFSRLSDGWDAGSDTSRASSAAACDTAREIVGRMLCAKLPLPYVYPMPDGGVSLEWGLVATGVNAEVQSNATIIDLMSWSRGDDETSEAEFRADDIDAIAGWLAQQIDQ